MPSSFTIVDIHVDMGQATIVYYYDKIKKLWLTWPSTKNNKLGFYKAKEDPNQVDDGKRYINIVRGLTNGNIFIADKLHSVYMLNNYLHMTYTLFVGCLCGRSLNKSENANSLMMYVVHEIELQARI